MNIFKKLFIPSGEKTSVVAYNSWIVRWRSWHTLWDDSTYANHKLEAEIFPSEEDAIKFAEQLRDAYKLTRCSGGAFRIKIEENQNRLATLSQ